MASNTDINEALLQDLLAIYTDAENQMLEKVAKRVKKGVTEEGWNEKKLEETIALRQEIEELLKDKNKVAKLKVGEGILKAYKHGVNSVEKDAGKPTTAMSELNVPLTIQNMLLTNYNLIDDASSKILRNVDDAYREVMAEAATGLLSGVDTRITASQKMMDKLAAKGITSFTDKAGRRWSMSTYTEMAMRTASAHAAIEGHIQTQQSFGMDLMKVSSIGTTCPICAKWQGVVLSISGKTPGYLTVDAARADGLFHPNCKHTLLMYDPELDGPGQRELNDDAYVEQTTKTYDLLQQQRSNERAIRFWKRREAAAVDPKSKKIYRDRVNAAIAKNIAFCDANGLRRMPKREGFKAGDPKKAYTVGVGTHLKEYTSLSPESVKALSDLGFAIPKKSTKVSVSGQLSKPAAGDNKGSVVSGLSDTEAYKKMFGTKPADDFKAAGGEEGTGMKYGKWLATKVKAEKAEPFISEADLKNEIKADSLTVVYKKYISPDPSPDFKAAGGEEGTGLKYAQWLKQQVYKLSDPNASVIPSNKPFDNQAISSIQAKTKAAADQIDAQKAQKKVQELETEIKNLDNEVYDLKKEVNKMTTSKIYGVWSSAKNVEDYEELKASGSIQAKKDYYNGILAEKPNDKWAKLKLEDLAEFEELGEKFISTKDLLEKKEEKIKADEKELAKVKPFAPEPPKPKAGDLTPEKAKVLALKWADDFPKTKSLGERVRWTKSFFQKSTGVPDHLVDQSLDPHIVRQKSWRENASSQKEKDMRMGWFTLYDYTKASGKLNWPARGVDRNKYAETNDPDLNGVKEMEYYKKRGKYLDKLFDESPGIPKDITLKRKAGNAALFDFFSLPYDEYDDGDWDELEKRIKEANANPGSYVGADKGWLSMGTSKTARWSGNVGFITRATKGTKAIYSEPVSHYQGGTEIETLLKRNQQQKCVQVLRPYDPEYNDICENMGWTGYDVPDYIVITETIPD